MSDLVTTAPRSLVVTAPDETATQPVTEREKRARTLEAAALEIEVRGWIRNEREDEAGRVCLVGAIQFANGIAPYTEGEGSPYAQAARTWRGLDGTFADHDFGARLADFNDAADSHNDATFVLRWRAAEIRDGL